MSVRRIRLNREGSRGERDADYDVGYRKPPHHTRFKPGQSGNPKGRSRGNRNLKTDLSEEMAERIEVAENGRKKKITKQRLVLKAMATKAIKGDTRAATLLVRLIAQILDVDDQAADESTLTASDERLLSDFLEHHATSADDDGDSDNSEGDEHT